MIRHTVPDNVKILDEDHSWIKVFTFALRDNEYNMIMIIISFFRS